MTVTARKTITASRRAKDEVEKRHLTNILQLLRGKIEGNPKLYGGLISKLERAERAVFDGHHVQARDQIIEIERIIDEKDETAATQAQQAEQAKLAASRDQPTHTADSGASTRDGWLWLLNKQRFTGGRTEAGRVFREKYERSQGSLKSCISGVTSGGGDATISGEQSHARFELDGVRKHMASAVGATSGEALYQLLVAVVGRGDTVRQLVDGNDRKADGKVIELGFALDLAGVYLGVIRT